MPSLTTTITQERAFTDAEWQKLDEVFDLFHIQPLVVIKPTQQYIFDGLSFRIHKNDTPDAYGEPRVHFPFTQTLTNIIEGDHDFLRYIVDVVQLVAPGVYGSAYSPCTHATCILRFHGIDVIALLGKTAYQKDDNNVAYMTEKDTADTLIPIVAKLIADNEC